jgi:parvulin-like peptidyl-prolyl isomerase
VIDELIDKHSEDTTSRNGEPLRIEPGDAFPMPLVSLALRLKDQEAGIVATDYGYHVVLRVPKPEPDPLESTAILKREEETWSIYWQHILIGWDQRSANHDPRARARTKQAADTLAQELLDKVRAKGDMAKLMKQHSEDPKTKDNGRVLALGHAPLNPVERLAIRLKVDEAGLVRSARGWHIVKRVAAPPPPPPDKLESTAILKRKPETDVAKVKHIIIGWDEMNDGDPRAVNRTRAQLEKLVADLLARLKKGEDFEALMVAHSEDTLDAVKSGKPIEVTADAQLTLPFINLSRRLKVGEVGVVRTEFGLHIVKRVE